MEPCDLTFDMVDWRSVPVVEERVATDDDLRNCGVFFVRDAGASEPWNKIDLPALARSVVNADNKPGNEVVVVQIEYIRASKVAIAMVRLPNGMATPVLLSNLVIVETAK
jgi:hypothetical protein